MRCSSCGAENRAGARFCSECGQALASACPSCGASVEATAKFCSDCGTPLAGQRPTAPSASGAVPFQSPPPPAEAARDVASERRLVTVLFADLVGFTTLSEHKDPEEVRDLLTRYFDNARVLIERYGGVVEKFIGDAVMAVWGTPVAHEDDAERAVRAALELVDAVSSLGASVGAADLRLRAGVLTGEAAVTLGAAGQGMVAGDLVNTAARLQSAAAPGTVLVGQSTFVSANKAIAFEEAGAHTLKGKDLPVDTWRARHVVGGTRGFRRSETLEAPFVGREEELRLLKDLLHASARERRPRLVSVTGIGGIGKSRLAWELFKYVDGLVESIYWHQGRCPAYGEGVTFWALGEMVRMRARIAETEDARSSRAKLTQTVEDYIEDPTERRWIEPRLAHLLGLEQAPPGEKEELFAAWRAFFEHIAARGPTVMVFEDLQWADTGLIDFIEHVLQWARLQPIFIVTLARPELYDKRPNWGAGQRSFTSVYLEPLPVESMQEMLSGLVGGLDQDVVAQILDRAEGIPLYAVEIVRMLVDTGRLVPEDGGYRVAGPLERLEIPDTLHALIAARLDTLSPRDRSLLQDASVLGKTFTVGALEAVVGDDCNDLESCLAGLVAREFLVVEADPRSPERGQYGFVQSVIREVAYQTLSRRERRDRHVKAAHYFESGGDHELAGVIAAHYMHAFEYSPPGPEAEDYAAKGRRALIGAADRAGSLGAHDQALAYLEQALEITTDPQEQAILWELAADAAQRAANYDAAHRLLTQSIERYQREGDLSAAMRATARLGSVLLAMGEVGSAMARLQAAPADLSELRSDPEVVNLTAELARAHMLNLESEQAIKWADEALPAAERLQLLSAVADLLTTKGAALQQLGRAQEGMALTAGAVNLAEKHALQSQRLRALFNYAGVLWDDSPVHAMDAARTALDVSRNLGDREWELAAAALACEFAIFTGEWDWAEANLQETYRDGVSGYHAADLGTTRAVLRALGGNVGAASEILEASKSLVEDLSDPQLLAQLRWAEGRVRLAAGDLGGALDNALSAVAAGGPNKSAAYLLAARAALWSHDPSQMSVVLARLENLHPQGQWIDCGRRSMEAGRAALEGRRDEAVHLYQEVFRNWRDLGVPFDLAMSQLDFVIAAGPEVPEARAAAEEARGIFTDLGARPFLERLDAALAVAPPVRPSE